ncbi:UNVERIFIED_CONTAM: hypothetical protein NCL1_45544 [Trichonephila clavipes]
MQLGTPMFSEHNPILRTACDKVVEAIGRCMLRILGVQITLLDNDHVGLGAFALLETNKAFITNYQSSRRRKSKKPILDLSHGQNSMLFYPPPPPPPKKSGIKSPSFITVTLFPIRERGGFY